MRACDRIGSTSGIEFRSSSVCEIGALYCRGGSTHGMFKLKAIALCVHANAGRKMPLAQAHPFQPMPVTHEEADPQEVSECSAAVTAANEKYCN